jgi:polysaccharide export outer membrane protein
MASAVLRRRSAVWFALLPLWTSCAGAPPFDAKAVAMEWQSYMQRDYSLRPGDKLIVRVLGLPSTAGATPAVDEGTQQVIISPTGTVDLNRLPGPLQLAGKTVGAARTSITEAYIAANVKDPRVSVTLAEASVQTVYVAGEVGTAGAIPYRPGMTVTQAIAAAGSFRITVKESDIRVLRINPDGTQRTFRVNVSDVLYSEYPDFLLLPGDVVFAQTSTIADMGNWVELYIRRLLPFAITGVSVGGKQ